MNEDEVIMMTIRIEPSDKCLYQVSRNFQDLAKDEWFEDPMTAEMIQDIDQTKQIAPRIFDSPVLGYITRQEVSGGVKGLILLLHEKKWNEVRSSTFGENCVPWICKISFLADFAIVMTHPLEFRDDVPVQAQTPDGILLNTAEEVWAYYERTAP